MAVPKRRISKGRTLAFTYNEKLGMMVTKKPKPYVSSYCASPVIINESVIIGRGHGIGFYTSSDDDNEDF